jgi:hypothetical protein
VEREVTTPYEGDPPLTDEQQLVVEQPADALLLVTAGAGAGKTHTLVRRLDHLVDEEELGAGEILVFSFSRAAVREVRDRLARHGESARYVRAQTFDSWALDLLMEVRADGDWPSRAFDDRIRAATDAIADGLADERYEEDLRHVVIDEVQDLVGDRRELVETLLERYDCGFTVVGDAAQAIYGFQVADPVERAGETNRFFDWLRVTFDEDLTELSLTANFRTRTDEARGALGFGDDLRSGAESRRGVASDTYDRLRTVLLDLIEVGDLTDQFVCSGLSAYDGTSAILSRTNGQALLISELLHRGGVSHRLQRAAQDRAVPAWVAGLIRTAGASVVTRERFDELVPALPLPVDAEPDTVWGLLTRAGGSRSRRSIDLGQIRSAIAEGRLPDELTAQPPAPLVVSSFHRAKGLEFDRVIVVDPGPLRTHADTDPEEEARILYVAMTRPRDELLRLSTPDTRLVRLDRATDRWARYGWQKWLRMGLELGGRDVHPDHPAGVRGFEDDPVELQKYLATKVLPGDDVVLERLSDESLEFGQSPPYVVMHSGRPIGITSESFRTAVYRYLRQSSTYVPRNHPRLITGVRIDAVETVAGSEAAGTLAGLGNHGVWLAPRLTGLSRFQYDKKDDGREASDA